MVISISILSCSETQSIATNKDNIEQKTLHNNVDSKTFHTLLTQKLGTLVDVRTKGELSNGKIKGALHIDYYSPDFTSQLAKLDRSKPLFLYCASGARSRNARRKIEALGFTEVYNLQGGINAWQNSGFPTTK